MQDPFESRPDPLVAMGHLFVTMPDANGAARSEGRIALRRAGSDAPIERRDAPRKGRRAARVPCEALPAPPDSPAVPPDAPPVPGDAPRIRGRASEGEDVIHEESVGHRALHGLPEVFRLEGSQRVGSCSERATARPVSLVGPSELIYREHVYATAPAS